MEICRRQAEEEEHVVREGVDFWMSNFAGCECIHIGAILALGLQWQGAVVNAAVEVQLQHDKSFISHLTLPGLNSCSRIIPLPQVDDKWAADKKLHQSGSITQRHCMAQPKSEGEPWSRLQLKPIFWVLPPSKAAQKTN